MTQTKNCTFLRLARKCSFYDYNHDFYRNYFKNNGKYLELIENMPRDIIFLGAGERESHRLQYLSIQNAKAGRKRT